jgi:two-component system chemotaxis response regulator CheB
MADTVRVLVVDDSVTMRALFSGILNDAPGITVLDHAADADEARDLIAKLKPDVVTLDVEMPGMSGLEFLEEMMAENPLPVIMLSTLTQKGSEATLKALELGAFECFPKPQRATMDEFAKIGPRLAKLVKSAAKSGGKPRPAVVAPSNAPAMPTFAETDYNYGDSLLALVANTGGVDALSEMIQHFPSNCPPTIIHLAGASSFIDAFISKFNAVSKPNICVAADNQPLEIGHVYIVCDSSKHAIIDKWPQGRLRLIDGEPIGGHRPSANLLLGTIAKTAGSASASALLTGIGEDGVAGLMAIKTGGGLTVAQDPDTARAAELPELAIARGAAAKTLNIPDAARELLLYRAQTSIAA